MAAEPLRLILAGSGRELPPVAAGQQRLPPPRTAAAVRADAARRLGVHEEQVVLLLGNEELGSGPAADAALHNAGPEDAVTVVTCPCRVRPSEYRDFIVPDTEVPDAPPRPVFGEPVHLSCVRVDEVRFPEPLDIQINMMPFIIGDQNSVPEEYRQYWPMVCRCVGLLADKGKVGFLTIQESVTQKGESQRRPGLHTETPGTVMRVGGEVARNIRAHWGRGHTEDGLDLSGGIYMASNVQDSCRIWRATLQEPHRVVGTLGDVEHLRPVLDELGSVTMGANELWWITDTTPHESLPMVETTMRQYFRVVSSSVSIWYAKHSTVNRLGVRPDSSITHIVQDDKFDMAYVERTLEGVWPIVQSERFSCVVS